MNSKVELKPFIGIRADGGETIWDQWHVVADGRRIGILPHAEGSRLMPLVNLSDTDWDFVIKECERLRKGEVLRPIPIYEPPQELLEQEEEIEVEE
jgi:hypothetical protein